MGSSRGLLQPLGQHRYHRPPAFTSNQIQHVEFSFPIPMYPVSGLSTSIAWLWLISTAITIATTTAASVGQAQALLELDSGRHHPATTAGTPTTSTLISLKVPRNSTSEIAISRGMFQDFWILNR